MTTTDWRELCAELLTAYRTALYDDDLVLRARAALAQPDPALSQRPECFEFALDFLGYPENDQLREYIERLEARAALAQPVADGPTDEELDDCADELLDWNIEGTRAFARAVLARWGHHPAPPAEGEVGELLEELRRICFDVAPCDADTIKRAAALLEQRHPTPVPVTDPTDEQLLATVDAVTVTLPPLPRDQSDAHGRIAYDIAWRIAMARAVLARWGGQAAPVPVAERLPGAEDCDAEGRCWWLLLEHECDAMWCESPIVTHWLSATAIQLPAEKIKK